MSKAPLILVDAMQPENGRLYLDSYITEYNHRDVKGIYIRSEYGDRNTAVYLAEDELYAIVDHILEMLEGENAKKKR